MQQESPSPKPTKRRRPQRKSTGQRRVHELEATAASEYEAEEKRLALARDPDALQRMQWRTAGRTLPALRSLAAAYTGRAKVRVLRAGDDGLPELVACPDTYEGPMMLWRRSGSTSGYGVTEATYALSYQHDVEDSDDPPVPEVWRDLPPTASLEAKAQHRLKVAQERCGWSPEGDDLGATTALLVLVPVPERRVQVAELLVCQRCRADLDRTTDEAGRPCAPCRLAEQKWHLWVNAERDRRGEAARAARAAAGRRAAHEQAEDLRRKADALERQHQPPPR
jgi:hypothetical protein